MAVRQERHASSWRNRVRKEYPKPVRGSVVGKTSIEVPGFLCIANASLNPHGVRDLVIEIAKAGGITDAVIVRNIHAAEVVGARLGIRPIEGRQLQFARLVRRVVTPHNPLPIAHFPFEAQLLGKRTDMPGNWGESGVDGSRINIDGSVAIESGIGGDRYQTQAVAYRIFRLDGTLVKSVIAV